VAAFLVELYVSKADAAGARRAIEAARRAADEMASAGTPIRIVCSVFLPVDETCLLLYEAESADAVRRAARRASFPGARVAEAVAVAVVDANEH
jgi:hypothetical protein